MNNSEYICFVDLDKINKILLTSESEIPFQLSIRITLLCPETYRIFQSFQGHNPTLHLYA